MINICAPGNWDLADSYGLIACQLSRQLTSMGYPVNAYALGEVSYPGQPPDIAYLASRPRIPVLGGIFLGYPTNYFRHGAMALAGSRVAITMFESSKLPPGWAQELNKLDAVITPSRFCSNLFWQAGVTVPIWVCPLGLSSRYQPRPLERPDRPLTFLAFLDRGTRKGGTLALNAFIRAFGDRSDVHLILKGRETYRRLEITNSNVTVIARDMTEAELYQLFLKCDVLVSPSTGEGFGLIPREFAATGGVSLATNWSGTAEDIELWGVPLDYQLVDADWKDAKNLQGQDLGQWAKVDREHLADVMADVFLHQDYYLTRALVRAEIVRQKYTWADFGSKVLTLWKGLISAADISQPSQPIMHSAAM